MSTPAYPLVPFWSLADLRNKKTFSRGEIVQLERIESATGRLIDDGVLDSEEGLEDQNDEAAESASEGKAFQAGDVLFGKLRPYLSKSWLADKAGTALGDIHVYRPSEGCDSRFLAYLVLSSGFVGLADASSSGTKMPRTEWSKIGQFKMPAPPLPTQRAIADYLDRETAEIDDMRADLDEMERLLEERRAAVVERLLLGESTPDLANLPRQWKKTTVGTLFSLHNGDRGINYPSPDEITETGVPFVNAGGLASGRINLETCKRIKPEKYAAMGGAKLRKNDLLFCLRGSLGKWGLVDFDGGALASSLCALRLERVDLADVKYIAHAMDTRVFSLQVWLSESGSAQPNLGAEQVSRFRVPLPPLAEQRRIANEIDRETAEIDSMLEDITKLRDLLAERRAAVISAAVTGRIDIPVSPTHKDEPHA